MKPGKKESFFTELIGQKFGMLTVLNFSSKRQDKRDSFFECKCDCGNTKIVSKSSLIRGEIIACGCQQRKFHVGDVVSNNTIIGISDKRSKNGNVYYICKCKCGKITEIQSIFLTRKRGCGYCKFSKEINASTKFRGYEGISGTTWRLIKRGARQRNLEMTVTIEELWNLFLKQDRKCALSGIDIHFPLKSTRKHKGTASLDRIDSSKGYTLDNIQWVHKDVNKMKQDLDELRFIELCKLIGFKTRDELCVVF